MFCFETDWKSDDRISLASSYNNLPFLKPLFGISESVFIS